MPRCHMCKYRKSFLLKCKCGNEYCSSDILPEKHKCVQILAFRKEAFNKNEKIVLESAKKEELEWIQ